MAGLPHGALDGGLSTPTSVEEKRSIAISAYDSSAGALTGFPPYFISRRRRDLLLGHVSAQTEDGLLEACPLLGGAALRFDLGLRSTVRPRWARKLSNNPWKRLRTGSPTVGPKQSTKSNSPSRSASCLNPHASPSPTS